MRIETDSEAKVVLEVLRKTAMGIFEMSGQDLNKEDLEYLDDLIHCNYVLTDLLNSTDPPPYSVVRKLIVKMSDRWGKRRGGLAMLEEFERARGVKLTEMSAEIEPETADAASDFVFDYDYDSDLFLLSAAADAKDWEIIVHCGDGNSHKPKPQKFTPYPGCKPHDGATGWVVEYYKAKKIEIRKPGCDAVTVKHPDA